MLARYRLTVSDVVRALRSANASISAGDVEEGKRRYVVRTEGATLRALHTPGHAEDHLCFVLEEEGSLFSGDNVLGVGTTVIPAEGGDLLDYMRSLERLTGEVRTAIYPAHGPKIEDGPGKLSEYIEHRQEREREIVAALRGGRERIPVEAPEARADEEAPFQRGDWVRIDGRHLGQVLRVEGKGSRVRLVVESAGDLRRRTVDPRKRKVERLEG